MSSTGQDGALTGARLRSFVERIERLEADRASITVDLREVYSELRGSGFDVPAVRQIVRLRKMDASDRQEREQILETYRAALGL